jgi:tRNA(fMet)-specific endonuclease VapC
MIECTVDSTTIIDTLRGKREVARALTQFSEIGLSHVALGELLLGVFKSSDSGELNRTLRVIRGMTLLHGDGDTAVIYAGIRRDLERQGSMIPQNDIWIAAASLQANVPLVTRDQHFRCISQLKLVEY